LTSNAATCLLADSFRGNPHGEDPRRPFDYWSRVRRMLYI
jgi:hypothetical protein